MDLFREREALFFLVGRFVLEGMTAEQIAEHWNIKPELVAEGWRVTQEQLSLDLSLRDNVPNRLWSVEELRSEITYCLKRLLEWREQLQSFTASAEPPRTAIPVGDVE